MLLNIDSPEKFKKFEVTKKKEPVLMLYYADWCYFCQQFRPTWNNFVRTTHVNSAEVESSNLSLMNSSDHHVSSYPTLKLFVKDKVIVFEDDRSINNINKFIEKHVPKKNKTPSKPKTKPTSKTAPKPKPTKKNKTKK